MLLFLRTPPVALCSLVPTPLLLASFARAPFDFRPCLLAHESCTDPASPTQTRRNGRRDEESDPQHSSSHPERLLAHPHLLHLDRRHHRLQRALRLPEPVHQVDRDVAFHARVPAGRVECVSNLFTSLLGVVTHALTLTEAGGSFMNAGAHSTNRLDPLKGQPNPALLAQSSSPPSSLPATTPCLPARASCTVSP